MKIGRITATPINLKLDAPYRWVFGELDGFSPTIVEVDWRACRARMQESSRALDQGESMDLSTLT
jgi:hypothetical protein